MDKEKCLSCEKRLRQRKNRAAYCHEKHKGRRNRM